VAAVYFSCGRASRVRRRGRSTALRYPPMKPSEYLSMPQNEPHLKVRAVLRRWDPIGVITEDNQDEYDSYSVDVVRLLDRGATVDEIVKYMRWVVTDRIGMSHFDEARSRDCAQELVDSWSSRHGG
jgi:hypothetical protein